MGIHPGAYYSADRKHLTVLFELAPDMSPQARVSDNLICEREHFALYDHRDSLRSCLGLWIGSSGYSEGAMKSLHRSMVRVVRIFKFKSRRKSGLLFYP